MFITLEDGSRLARLYEIEHDGDADDAVAALHRAGASHIQIVERDYEGSECMTVKFRTTLPAADFRERLEREGGIL